MSKDFGVPTSTGQNKSFIIQKHPEYGALLGKYMIHSAGKEMSELMRKQGNLHMIMQESAVKQKGTREIGDYFIDSDRDFSALDKEIEYVPRGEEARLQVDAKMYEIKPEEIFGSYGVYGTEHMLGRQGLPKQVLGNLVPLSRSPIETAVIDDMFNTIVGNRFRGDSLWNDKVDLYLDKTAKGGGKAEDIRKMEIEIESNIESIGMEHLIKAMKNDHSPRLTEIIYNRILKVEKNNAYEEFMEGNITESEYNSYNAELNETNNIIDKVVRLSNEWVAEQAASGIDVSSTPIYMHKFIRDFRMKAVQNFIVNSVTKPKMQNSGVGFIRPYDKAMQFLDGKYNPLLDINNKEGINYKDDLFFLDNDFRKTVVHTDLANYERIALGRLWDAYQNKEFTGENKKYIEEVFRAATVRVPADSISGVQVLKFGGFTGRKGHGILMHSRAMRAEGGADLDGDKSYFFLGGKGGWKKEWKDAYHSNKGEHYSADGRRVSDNKDALVSEGEYARKGLTYTELLSEEFSPEQKRKYNSKTYQYAPSERIRISQAAVEGRNLLGPAVIQKQVMSAAYNSIVAGGGEDIITLEKWEKGKKVFYQVTIQARTDKDALTQQRKMGRAQLGLASDPLDVLGLKKKDKWFEYMWNAHFKVKDVKKQTGKGRLTKIKTKDFPDMDARDLRGGILKDYYDVNSAYWGRNHKEGRKHSMDEIKDLGKAVYNINDNPERMNNALAKTAELLQGHDWSDSIFGRLEKTQVEALYTTHQKNLKKYDWLKRILGRSSFKTVMGSYINNTMEYSLWKDITVIENDRIVGGIDAVANSTELFKGAVKGTLFAKDKKLMDRAINNEKGVRKDILRQIRALAEDFIVNDITDLTTLHNVSRIVEEMKESGDLGVKGAKTLEDAIDIIHRKVDYLKKRSYLMRNDRNNADVHYVKQRKTLGEDLDNLDTMLKEAAFGQADVKNMSTRNRKRIREVGDDITAALDQATIDLKIAEFKGELSPKAKQLFDHLMLGSLSRTNLDKIDNIAASMDKMDKTARDLIHHYRKLAAKTQTSRLGFNSEEIRNSSIKEHVGSYLSMYKEMWLPPEKGESQKRLDNIDKKFEDVKLLEDTVMPDDPLNQFLNESLMESGYKGLKKSKLTKEEKSLAAEIATLLKSFGNNKLGQDLNGITRGLEFIGKDLNAMNYQDFLNLRNYLQEAKRGNFIQRWKKRLGGKKGPVQLGWRHWMQIPETTGRELMVNDIQKMRTTGYFTDRYGNLREGRVVKPTNYIDMANNWYSLMVDKATGEGDKLIRRFQEDVQFLTGTEDSESLWRIAIRKRELDYASDLQNNPDKFSPDRKTETQEAIKQIYAEHSKAMKDTGYELNMKNKSYSVSIKGADGKVERGEMTGEQLVKRLNKKLDFIFDDMHRFIRGEPGALEPYIIGYWDPGTQLAPKIDYKKFIRHMQEHLTGGKTPWKDIARGEVPNIFGIDGLRAVARSMQLDLMPTKTKKQRIARNKIAKQPVLSTGKISKGYFPHMFFDAEVASKIMKEASIKILKTPDSEMSQKEKLQELKKIQYRHRTLEGDWNFKDMEEYEMFDSVVETLAEGKRVSEKQIKWFNSNERAGSMHSRTSLTSGYSIDPTVVETYMRSLSNTYYRQLSQMFGRHIVDKMGKEMPKKWGLEQTNAWQKWMQLYTNDAIGNPSIIPEKVFQDPVMKLKSSPYGWWADNRVRDKLNRIGGMLGFVRKHLGTREVDIKPDFVIDNVPGANLEHYKGIISGNFTAIDSGIKWIRGGKSGKRPIDTQYYGDKGTEYEYSGEKWAPEAWTPELLRIKRQVEAETGYTFNSAVVNKYRGGTDRIGYHKDDEPMIRRKGKSLKDIPIASVSFGAPRTFTLKADKSGRRHEFVLRDGDLFLMGGDTQINYKHGIEAEPAIQGSRINITFRRTNYGRGAPRTKEIPVKRVKEKITIPEELRGIDIDTVRWLSNLEAQYEMAALLAHPKSTVMNIFGGTVHTIQSAGFGNWRKAQQVSYLSKINPDWNSREAINQFAVSHGVVPEFLLYEMGLQKTFQSAEGKSLIKDIRNELSRNPDKSLQDMKGVASKHSKELWTSAVNWASKFMTIPEKRLRTDAFMAHYVYAWEKFGGGIKEFDHPFLIAMAKKGVKATQFLYNAPNRPAFARTALGKVMTRFQLYAWNSVKFRNEVNRQARIMGYTPGTEEYKRFQRTVTTDMFTLALANAFMYSMFNQNLPQPYGWLQDSAEWIFGDEEDRDRAFYGAWPTEVAPLQAVTPPILRMAGPTVDAMLTDDWAKMSNYYIWTMFPFGRIARDVAGENNLREVPSRAWEKLFGIPMQAIQRAATQAKKEREEMREVEESKWY